MDDAALHHDDAVAEDHGFVLVVRHDDGGDAEFAQDDGEFFADLEADLGVKGRERLVEKENLRTDRKGAGERDALALTAREGEDVARLVLLKVDETEHFVDGLFNLLLGFAPHRETVGDVLRDRHVRKERVLLRTLEPSSGVSRPAMMRRSVVFPQPEGPRRTVRHPASSVSVKGCSTQVLP